MKLKLLFILLFSVAIGFSQQQIYYTNFSASTAPVGWATEILEGSYDWYFGGSLLPGSTFFSQGAAMFNDDITFEDHNSVRITSPVFNLSMYDSAQLSFEYGLSRINGLGIFTVEVFDGAQWQQIMLVDTNTPPTQSDDIDVSMYMNENFQVRFMYDDEGIFGNWGAGFTNFLLEGSYSQLPNDDCAGAFPLICGATVNGTTVGATADTDAPVCNGINGSTNGAWYKFEDFGNQESVTVSLCNTGVGFDSKLNIYKGSCGALECVTASDDVCGTLSSSTFLYDGYSTYYVLVSGTTQSDFVMDVSCSPVAPENDDIANAIDVDQYESPYTQYAVPLTYATEEANGSDFYTTGCDMYGGWYPNVFYKFTAVADGTATVSLGTPNPGGFSIIAFYTAPNENATIADLTWVNQPTNGCNSMSDTKTINITAGQTYYIVLMSPYTNSNVIISLDYFLATANVSLQDTEIYPNPVSHKVWIQSTILPEKLQLYDLLGKNLLSITPDGLFYELDMSAFAKGTYIIKMVSGESSITRKIIKI